MLQFINFVLVICYKLIVTGIFMARKFKRKVGSRNYKTAYPEDNVKDALREVRTRDVEAVIFQTLPLPPLPLPPTKNEKTTVDNFFKLLWVCSLPSPTLYHFEETKTFIYCYYFTYFASAYFFELLCVCFS